MCLLVVSKGYGGTQEQLVVLIGGGLIGIEIEWVA